MHCCELVADPKAVVIEGNARFTVLTDRLIRCEYSSNGAFEDRPTSAVVNRRLPVPFFLPSRGPILKLETSHLRLEYVIGQPFNATSLTVTLIAGSPGFKWHYGQDQSPNNLLGMSSCV
jgi:hypothetical protein